MEEDESDNESDEDDDETITVGGVHYNVQAKRRRGNEDQQVFTKLPYVRNLTAGLAT